MPLVKVNFALAACTPPALNEVDFGLSAYAPSLDGDDFALTLYTPPALDAVNFELISLGPGIIERFISAQDSSLSSILARIGQPFSRTLSPTLSLASVFTRLYSGAREITGNLDMSSVFTRLFDGTRAFAGNMNLSSVFTRIVTFLRNVADADSSLSSIVNRYFNGVRSLDFVASLSSSLARSGSWFRRKLENPD